VKKRLPLRINLAEGGSVPVIYIKGY